MKSILIASLTVFISTHTMAMDSLYNLTVGLIDEERYPYWFISEGNQEPHGAYIDILEEISIRTGISFTYKFAPPARIRRYMIMGDIDVEPGINETWRTEPGEAEASVYSEPFYRSNEVIAYWPGDNRIDGMTLNDFKDAVPCSIVGFDNIAHPGYKKTPVRAVTERQMMQQLKQRRCDFAVFPIDVIQEELDYGYLLSSAPINSYNLKLRLTKKNQHLLNEINSAINAMKQRGDIERIISKYKGR